MKDKLNKIQIAFSKLGQYQNVFLDCERAYNAVYKENERSRTGKLKNTKDMSRSKLYVPLIKTTCDIIHSIFKTSFLSAGCPIEIKRIGMRENHDTVLQNALNLLVKKHWQDMSHKVGLSRAVLSAIYLPLGVLQVYWENDSVRTKHISISDIAFDPYANDISDIDFVAYRWRQSKVEVKKKLKEGFYTLAPEITPEQVLQHGQTRCITKELYERRYEEGREVWRLSTFVNNHLVREVVFDSLPFAFGYCLESMPPVFRATESVDDISNVGLMDYKGAGQNYYIGVYGSCLPMRVKEIQEEYNIKRNQKIDLIERMIDPQFIVAMNKGRAYLEDIYNSKKIVRVETAQGESVSSVIMPLQTPNTMSLNDELAILKDEYERATGVNSIMTGQTSPSDRRAMGALQVVNASSSMRIEAMLQTLADTMLNEYARKFVELVYQNASDEEIIALSENPEIISVIGTREQRATMRLDFDIKTNFGTTISQEMEVSQLNNLMGIMAQCGLNDPRITAPLLRDIMVLMRGENAPIEEIDNAFNAVIAQQQAQEQVALAQQEAQAAQNDPSVIEAQAMAQAAAVAEQNELERQRAVENAAYEGGL